MASNLGTLARDAGLAPGTDVFPDLRPHKTGGDQLQGRFDPWMAEPMQGIKDLLAELPRNQWTDHSMRGVAPQVDTVPGNPLELEAGLKNAGRVLSTGEGLEVHRSNGG